MKNTVLGLRRGKHQREGFAGLDGDGAGVDGLAVKKKFEGRLLCVRGIIGHAGVNGPFAVVLRVLAQIERGDAEVFRAIADAMVNDVQVLVLELAQVARRRRR